ncbi:MAG: universal stress protein [Thermoleophilaceae bacterium]
MSKPILVGFDPRRGDRAPVEFAVAAARFTGARLIVVSVESGGRDADADLLVDASDVLGQVAQDIGADGIEAEFRKVKSSSAARALHELAEAQDAGLLVVGSSRRSPVGRVLLGSTAERLMHGATCPVAVVPERWQPKGSLETIGVAYSDSDEARVALRGAHAFARRARAKLRVVTIVEHRLEMHLETEPTLAGRAERTDLEDVEGLHRVEAEKHLREVVAELGDDVEIEVDALLGDPADVLIDLSRFMDLLVCGSRAYGPLRAVLLGSVSRRVTSEARCPVIVVPRGVEISLEAVVADSGETRLAAY